MRENPDVVGYRWNLSVHLSGLASLEWAAGRFTEAETHSRSALGIAEEIATRVPARIDYRALVAKRRFELADLTWDRTHTPAALPIAKSAVRRRDVALARGLLVRTIRELEARLAESSDDGNAHTLLVRNVGYLALVHAMEGDAHTAT